MLHPEVLHSGCLLLYTLKFVFAENSCHGVNGTPLSRTEIIKGKKCFLALTPGGPLVGRSRVKRPGR
jgi:hypothetical protein